MFLACLSDSGRWQPFVHDPVFLRSLQWITENADSIGEGIHELGEQGWFVNVHGYTTQARDLCAWENHPETIDIQYLIAGIEGIDLAAVEVLGPPTAFIPEADTQKFSDTGEPVTQLVLRAGDFVIFLPGEAHRPRVALQEPVELKKLVVKIPVRLLGQG